MVGMVITKRVSVTGHYINFRPSVQAQQAFCCEFPAFLLPMAGNQSSGFEFGLAPSFLRRDGQKPRICSKVSPWSAECGSWFCGPVWAYQRGA